MKKELFTNMFGALYEDENNIIGVQWDSTVNSIFSYVMSLFHYFL